MLSAQIADRETTMRFRSLTLALVSLAALVSASAVAQTRSGPLKIIFPFPGGGSGDALTRMIAEQLGTKLDRPVIVEPRAGAAGRLGVQAAKAAEPDGNTLLVSPIAPMVVYPSVYP